MDVKSFDIDSEYIKQIKTTYFVGLSIVLLYIVFALVWHDLYASLQFKKYVIIVGGSSVAILILFELYVRRGLLYWLNVKKIDISDTQIIIHKHNGEFDFSNEKGSTYIYQYNNKDTRRIILFIKKRKVEIVPEIFCNKMAMKDLSDHILSIAKNSDKMI